MRIGILGTRGIPNHYGGFEQFAEFLSVALVEMGYEVYVYNSSLHPYQESSWNNVNLIHCRDYEDKYSTAGQFIYDFNCIKDAKKRNFDIVLQLGYTSSSVWGWLLKKQGSIVITNMDGLEWKRKKFSFPVRLFLRVAEKLAVKYSDYLISDSVGIQSYLRDKYNIHSTFIPYGANPFSTPNQELLTPFNLLPFTYCLLIARMEPENSIDLILRGFHATDNDFKLIVVGRTDSIYGQYLRRKYSKDDRIVFVGGIFDMELLNNLRYFSSLYFHGHTVGGTNPSLLEAMAANSVIAAHDNIFNKSVLGNDAFYFDSHNDVSNILRLVANHNGSDESIRRKNVEKVKYQYNWSIIFEEYDKLFKRVWKQKYKIAPSFVVSNRQDGWLKIDDQISKN